MLRLTGAFTADNESLSPLAGARVEQALRARDVFVTAQGPRTGPGVTVDVTLDGRPVPAGQRGADLRLEGTRTVLDLDGSRLFSLLTGPQARLGTLGLVFRAPGARLFTLTYGG